MSRATALLLTMLLAACSGGSDDVAPRVIDDARYRPGQEWSFDPRPGEAGATLVVLRTEAMGDEVVVHVAIHGVRLAVGGVTATLVAHAPFSRAALDASGLVLVHEGVPIPPFEDGYAEWRRARGGVWTRPVREVLDAMETAATRTR